MNSATPWTENDTARAVEIWNEYWQRHDLSDRQGQVAGIDPVSGAVWFGESAKDIARQMEAESSWVPFYSIRVGYDYYVRIGWKSISMIEPFDSNDAPDEFMVESVR